MSEATEPLALDLVALLPQADGARALCATEAGRAALAAAGRLTATAPR